MPAVVSFDAAADFCSVKKIRMATHILERREQLRPLLKAAVDADALKRGASLEEVSRLHDELTREDWKEMLKQVQELRLT